MCGIVGYSGPWNTGRDWLKGAIQSMAHRGPDNEGIWVAPAQSAGMAHARLSILDLSQAGAQPMGLVDGRCCGTEGFRLARDLEQARYVLAYNGEIYNFRELRSELEQEGVEFISNSDTEVLLQLLARQGISALQRVAGMFAFAFYDNQVGKMILARDAHGIKPLYYSTSGSTLRFASELRSLREFGGAVDCCALRDLLIWGAIPEPHTICSNVKLLPAGCSLEWDTRTATVQQWHTWGTSSGTGYPGKEPLAVARDCLIESVERHLIADVPVGIFLSGGIDSTAILALCREIYGKNVELKTFSIGFDDPSFDESDLAKRTAEHFATCHTQWCISEEEGRAEIGAYLQAMDQPTTDGFNTWCVSKLAKSKGLKVVLSGLGGDELFGGYPSFRNLPRLQKLYTALRPLRGGSPYLFSWASTGSKWRRLAAFLRGDGSPLSAFHVQRGLFTESEARLLAKHLTGIDPGPANWETPNLPAEPLSAISALETTRYMRNQLLRDSDVFSMAHGLELRVPLVDSRLTSALDSIHPRIRFRPGKQLLLDAVPEIPSWIRNQPKRGFRFPFQQWIEGKFGELLDVGDLESLVPSVTWYRKWASAVVYRACMNS